MTRKERYKEIFERLDPLNHGLTVEELRVGEKMVFNYISKPLREQLQRDGVIFEIGGRFYYRENGDTVNSIHEIETQEEMSTVSNVEHQRINVSSEVWEECSKVAASFANILFTKVENCKKGRLARKAAHAGYAASVNQTDAFVGSLEGPAYQRAREQIRTEAESKIVSFLEGNDFTLQACYCAIEDIRRLYEERGVNRYTYGNAQKWLNMAIKYYIFIKSCYVNEAGEWIPFDFKREITLENIVKRIKRHKIWI